MGAGGPLILALRGWGTFLLLSHTRRLKKPRPSLRAAERCGLGAGRGRLGSGLPRSVLNRLSRPGAHPAFLENWGLGPWSHSSQMATDFTSASRLARDWGSEPCWLGPVGPQSAQ